MNILTWNKKCKNHCSLGMRIYCKYMYNEICPELEKEIKGETHENEN